MVHPQVIAYRSGELPPEPTDRSGPNNRAEMQDFLGRLAAKHGSRKYTTNNRPLEWEVYSSDTSDQVKLLKTRLGLQLVCLVDRLYVNQMLCLSILARARAPLSDFL